jgi:hypothetical protein
MRLHSSTRGMGCIYPRVGGTASLLYDRLSAMGAFGYRCATTVGSAWGACSAPLLLPMPEQNKRTPPSRMIASLARPAKSVQLHVRNPCGSIYEIRAAPSAEIFTEQNKNRTSEDPRVPESNNRFHLDINSFCKPKLTTHTCQIS